jgi:hypothetical protein
VRATATGPLLWGATTAALAWPVLLAVDRPAATMLACLAAVLVTLGGGPGLGLAAVVALLGSGPDGHPAPAFAAVAVVAAGAAAAPVRWLAGRCGPLPVGQLCAAVAFAVVVAGPLGGFVAPAGLAAVRAAAVRRPARGRRA